MNPKKILLAAPVLALALPALAQSKVALSGAGATFPYPIYAKWAYAYEQKTGVRVNYQSIGSGGGIQQINNKTVDFGASDAPVKDADLSERGQFQFPAVIGGVVPVVNLAGVASNQLKLTPDLLADIFLGKIKRWDDPRLKAANPGLALPGKEIVVVHRADGSGTTWVFTNYLTKVSPEWKEKVGNEKSVSWPVGLGGKGNEGVASYVRQVNGAIGYVEYAYAKQTALTTALLRNRDGAFVAPSLSAFEAAAAGADWKGTPNFSVILTDQPGKDSWPITGATWIIVYKNQSDCGRAQAMLDFWRWSLREGAEMARSLDYAAMPSQAVDLIEAAWRKEIRCQGKSLFPPGK
ncbi:MAG: phosphate ABC transporter substrate-binding protein PstS [Acidobacteriota bacterium]